MKAISILGATGSVGQSTLDLVEREPDRYRIRAVTANTDAAALAGIARRVGAEIAVVSDEAAYPALRDALAGSRVEAACGEAALCAAAREEVDWTMAAIVGAAGLGPTLAAVDAGITVALANKESLVCAGPLVLAAAKRSGARLLTVDSEHNAIFQAFDHDAPERVSSITITASGGPFRMWSTAAMRAATPAQAVAHPTWSMGAKISVDSATLMNKGLELIEAYFLFPLRVDQLRVIVHPQSVVHGLVEFIDGSVLAHLGPSDMRVPIAHALAWPERMHTPVERLDLAKLGRLDFEEPDRERFPALALAERALAAGGSAACVLNAANEVAVAAFLAGDIGFLDIAAIVADVLAAMPAMPISSLDDVRVTDAQARVSAGVLVRKRAA